MSKPKDDLISRAAALEAIIGCLNIMEANGIDMTVARSIVKSILSGAPAVDAIPVEWLEWRVMNAKYNGIKEAADAFDFVLNCWKEQEAQSE